MEDFAAVIWISCQSREHIIHCIDRGNLSMSLFGAIARELFLFVR